MHNAKILANIFFGLYFMVTTLYAFVCLEILFDDKSCFAIDEGEAVLMAAGVV